MNANAKKVDVVRGSGAPMDRHALWFDDTDKQLKYNDGDGWQSSNSSGSGTLSGIPVMRQPTQEDQEWLQNSELYSRLQNWYGNGCTLDLILTPASAVFSMPDGKVILLGDKNDDGSFMADTENVIEFYDKFDVNWDHPFYYFTKSEDGELVYEKIATIKSV